MPFEGFIQALYALGSSRDDTHGSGMCEPHLTLPGPLKFHPVFLLSFEINPKQPSTGGLVISEAEGWLAVLKSRSFLTSYTPSG